MPLANIAMQICWPCNCMGTPLKQQGLCDVGTARQSHDARQPRTVSQAGLRCGAYLASRLKTPREQHSLCRQLSKSAQQTAKLSHQHYKE